MLEKKIDLKLTDKNISSSDISNTKIFFRLINIPAIDSVNIIVLNIR